MTERFLSSFFFFTFCLSLLGGSLNTCHKKDYINEVYLYKEKLQYKKAQSLLFTLKDKIKKDEFFYLAGLFSYLEGDSKRAFSLLNKIKEKNWRVYLYLGLVCEDLNKKEEAKKFYLEVLNRKKISIASYRLGKVFFQEKEFRKAERYFKETIKIDPSIRLAYYYLGLSLIELNEYKEAYKYLSKTFNLYPQQKKIKKALLFVKKKLSKSFFVKKRKKLEEKRAKKKLFKVKRLSLSPQVKVKILETKKIMFKCGGSFFIYTPQKKIRGLGGVFYQIEIKKGKVFLSYKKNKEKIMLPVRIESEFPFYVLNVTYGEKEYWKKILDNAYRGDLLIFLSKRGSLVLVNQLSLEEYLYGVVSSEIPSSSPFEALKAQAVVARTIAFKNLGRHKKEGFDFCKDVHCQVYRGLSAETPRIRKAVDATRGEVIIYKNSFIEAFYHANCGGCLASDIFGEKEYLYSNREDNNKKDKIYFSARKKEEWFKSYPEDFFSSQSKNFRWQRIYDEEDFKLAFGESLSKLRKINILEEGNCAHKKKIEIDFVDKKEIIEKDYYIREHFDHLKSSAFIFEIKYKKNKPELLILWGAGFGHGAGLSQEGAIKMAQNGFSYKEIIHHYYKNVEIKKIY